MELPLKFKLYSETSLCCLTNAFKGFHHALQNLKFMWIWDSCSHLNIMIIITFSANLIYFMRLVHYFILNLSDFSLEFSFFTKNFRQKIIRYLDSWPLIIGCALLSSIRECIFAFCSSSHDIKCSITSWICWLLTKNSFSFFRDICSFTWACWYFTWTRFS